MLLGRLRKGAHSWAWCSVGGLPARMGNVLVKGSSGKRLVNIQRESYVCLSVGWYLGLHAGLQKAVPELNVKSRVSPPVRLVENV